MRWPDVQEPVRARVDDLLKRKRGSLRRREWMEMGLEGSWSWIWRWRVERDTFLGLGRRGSSEI